MNPYRAALLVLAAVGPCAAATAEWQAYEGAAMDLRSGGLAYTEQHFILGRAGDIAERVVAYRCPDGQAFARKRVDYAISPTAPGFELEDGRSGHREGARHVDAGLELFSAEAGSTPRRDVVALDDDLVADAGFDEFVRLRWERLVAGDTVRLRFALPARQDSFGFRIGRRDAREGELQLRLRLGGWLGWAAPDIDVAYSLQDRRLLRYEGLSNLSDPRGRPWQVRIEFPEAPMPADAAAVDRVLAEPLAGCSA